MTWQIAKYSLKSLRAALELAYMWKTHCMGSKWCPATLGIPQGNLCAVYSLASSVNAIGHLQCNSLVLEGSQALIASWMAALLKA